MGSFSFSLGVGGGHFCWTRDSFASLRSFTLQISTSSSCWQWQRQPGLLGRLAKSGSGIDSSEVRHLPPYMTLKHEHVLCFLAYLGAVVYICPLYKVLGIWFGEF